MFDKIRDHNAGLVFSRRGHYVYCDVFGSCRGLSASDNRRILSIADAGAFTREALLFNINRCTDDGYARSVLATDPQAHPKTTKLIETIHVYAICRLAGDLTYLVFGN